MAPIIPSTPKRNKGTFDFPSTFEVRNRGPLDARQRVETKNGLTLTETWQSNTGDEWTYTGMIVSVWNDTEPTNNGIYRLTASDYSVESNWELVGSTSEFPLDLSIGSDVSSGFVLVYDPFGNDPSKWYAIKPAEMEDIFILEASLNDSYFKWENGLLEPSVSSVNDASYNFLYDWNNTQDSSITNIRSAMALDSSLLWILDSSLIMPKNADHDVQLNSIEIEANSGAVSIMNMDVSTNAGKEESYSFSLNGQSMFKIYSESSTGGNISNTCAVVDAEYFSLGNPNSNGSWRFIITDGSLSIQTKVGGNWVERAKF